MPAFIHRQNPDGSWDSICPKCFLTVVASANVRDESELTATDARHECNISQHDSDRKGKS